MRESLVSSQEVFAGRVLSVRVDSVRLEDGASARREVVVHAGSVAILAVDAGRRALLVRQYRHPAGQELWELPAGRLEVGEEPLQAAARELAEEAGLAARTWRLLLRVWISPGYSSEQMWIFLATDLLAAEAEPDEDERLSRCWWAWPELVAGCLEGRLDDVKTIAATLAADAILGASVGSVPGPTEP